MDCLQWLKGMVWLLLWRLILIPILWPIMKCFGIWEVPGSLRPNSVQPLQFLHPSQVMINYVICVPVVFFKFSGSFADVVTLGC